MKRMEAQQSRTILYKLVCEQNVFCYRDVRTYVQRIFQCHIFPREDWQFGVLVFAVLFAWEMAWDSPIVNIVLQTTKTQLFMSALVIDGNLKLLSVKCCLETKMRCDVNYCMFVFATATDLYFNFNLRNPRKVYTVSATREEKQLKNLYTTCGPAFSRFRSGKTTWKGNSTKSRREQ